MEKLIYFLTFFAMTGLVAGLCAGAIRRSGRARVIFITTGSMLLMMLSVYLPGVLPLRFGEELSAVRWGAWLDERMNGTQSKAQSFLSSNCTLIDVSTDLELIPLPHALHDEMLAITDRGKLTALLGSLVRDTALYDVVIVDVLLDEATAMDSALAIPLRQLAEAGKLALATTGDLHRQPGLLEDEALRSSLGDVGEYEHDGLYFRHTLIHHSDPVTGELTLSLPYRAYARTTGLDELRNISHLLGMAQEVYANGTVWIRSWYNPLLPLASEESDGWLAGLKRRLGVQPRSYQLDLENRLLQVTSLAAAQPMGALLEPDGKNGYLHQVLAVHDKSEGPHCVVIGNFLDPSRDVHETAHGPMHGTAIILSVYHELLEGRHHVSWAFPAFMFLCFGLVLHLLINRTMGPVENEKQQEKKTGGRRDGTKPDGEVTQTGIVGSSDAPKHRWPVLRSIWEIAFVEEKHYWLLFAILLMAEVIFHRVVNLMSITLVLASMELVFRASMKLPSEQSSTSSSTDP